MYVHKNKYITIQQIIWLIASFTISDILKKNTILIVIFIIRIYLQFFEDIVKKIIL